jgi:hypothetical protein
MDSKGTAWECVELIHLAQDRDQWNGRWWVGEGQESADPPPDFRILRRPVYKIFYYPCDY